MDPTASMLFDLAERNFQTAATRADNAAQEAIAIGLRHMAAGLKGALVGSGPSAGRLLDIAAVNFRSAAPRTSTVWGNMLAIALQQLSDGYRRCL